MECAIGVTLYIDRLYLLTTTYSMPECHGQVAIMADLQFCCTTCRSTITLGREFSGGRVECPSCGVLTAVPGPRIGSLRSLGPDDALPPEVLGVEMKFLCAFCKTKLMIDFRWQGRTIDCPRCCRMTQVPRWFIVEGPIVAKGLPVGETRLTREETAFFTEDQIAS